MSNLLDHKEETIKISEAKIFNPFFDVLTDRFTELVGYELRSISSTRLNKESIFVSIKEEFRTKIVELSSKVLIYEFHESFTDVDPFNRSKNYIKFNEFLSVGENSLSILDKYPVLKEMCDNIQETLIRNSREIMLRYLSDVDELEEFFLEPLGALQHISINLGDTHRGGQSVAILNTEGKKIIYKPRSLMADCLYSNILSFYNEAEKESLQTPLTLDKEDYGWQEYIKKEDCLNTNQVKNYYKQLGMHLGFIYTFQGSDFHYENIIANGENPYLVDLETLFQPSLDFMERDKKKQPIFMDMLNKTVYKSLFFNNTAYPEEQNPRDVCGLSNTKDQQIEVEVVKEKNTDQIHIKNEVTKMGPMDNLPSIRNEPVEIFGSEKEFVEGFKKVYFFVLRNKESLLNIINSVKDFPIRIIIRPTYVYAAFLTSLLHPKYLIDKEERLRVLTFFHNTYQDYPFFQKVSKFEMNDLFHGDIPYFYNNFKQKVVFSSDSEVIDCKLVKASTSDEITEKINGLSEEDYQYQVSLINMGLTSLRANAQSKPILDFVDPYHNSSTYRVLEDVLKEETERIQSECLVYGKQAQWISLSLHPTGRVVAGPLNYNFYDGLGGILFFLSHYMNANEEHNFSEEINYLRITIEQLYKNTKFKQNYSAFHGTTSYIYLLEKVTSLGLVKEKDAREIYTIYCKDLIQNVDDIQATDFIGGLAGILKVLCLLYKKYTDPLMKDAADMAYEKIKAKVKRKEDLCYWEFDSKKEIALTGFSHGQTGIGYALSEYYSIECVEATRNEIECLIEGALRFEDQYYDSERMSWADNRKESLSFSDPFWCHGASGILLGRVKIKEHLGSTISIKHIDNALKNTIRNGQKHNKGNSLCHGTLGNVDILMEVRSSFDSETTDVIDQTISLWIEDFLNNMSKEGWDNGFELDSSNVGLMMGRSGQLYTLLRFQQSHIPCVLTLS